MREADIAELLGFTVMAPRPVAALESVNMTDEATALDGPDFLDLAPYQPEYMRPIPISKPPSQPGQWDRLEDSVRQWTEPKIEVGGWEFGLDGTKLTGRFRF